MIPSPRLIMMMMRDQTKYQHGDGDGDGDVKGSLAYRNGDIGYQVFGGQYSIVITYMTVTDMKGSLTDGNEDIGCWGLEVNVSTSTIYQ